MEYKLLIPCKQKNFDNCLDKIIDYECNLDINLLCDSRYFQSNDIDIITIICTNKDIIEHIQTILYNNKVNFTLNQ